eukprot:CAMPEP_0182877708 /NCGR_PEP_ID=MMETSP0034_2-20130328/14921_1 /TAXON_ID=156128 /ORGANISM="Nephroselmis pyriformis, Strain CCMP717" /LENGTH=162 /DNA_ID=CAMNT_0025010559 /DNA_START=147 /DNA_END=631 /DNA_ORIENTATION=+
MRASRQSGHHPASLAPRGGATDPPRVSSGATTARGGVGVEDGQGMGRAGGSHPHNPRGRVERFSEQAKHPAGGGAAARASSHTEREMKTWYHDGKGGGVVLRVDFGGTGVMAVSSSAPAFAPVPQVSPRSASAGPSTPSTRWPAARLQTLATDPLPPPKPLA